jgi:hypothetical protein
MHSFPVNDKLLTEHAARLYERSAIVLGINLTDRQKLVGFTFHAELIDHLSGNLMWRRSN